MIDPTTLSDEILSAFIDNELDNTTKQKIIEQLKHNDSLRERVYELQHAKDLVKSSFSHIITPIYSFDTNYSQNRNTFGALTISILIISAIIFSSATGYYYGTSAQHKKNIVINPKTDVQNKNIILHISENSPSHFNTALNYAEKHLNKNHNHRVVVIANAGGLNILRNDSPPYTDRISSLINTHKNIYFIACANSVKALHDKGKHIDLIQNAELSLPAMDHIINYIQKGWTYKKITRDMKT